MCDIAPLNPKHDPTIDDIYQTSVLVDNQLCTIGLVNHTSSEKFQDLFTPEVQAADAVVIAYNVCGRK